MNREIRPCALCAALLAAGLLTPTWALAQQAPGAQAQAATTEVDRIVVTGSKRGTRQREVAGTVTAIQGGQLEQLGAQDQEDVFKLSAGVQFNKGDPDRALPTIRGVGTVPSSSAIALQQATTGLYIEDVPFTDPFGFVGSADLAPFDLERVEVLRGPQGALYGSASLGGAVLYVLGKPDPKRTAFSLLGNVNRVSHGGTGYSGYAMVNLPVSGDSALRFVGFDRRDSGYIRNLGTADDRANELRQRGGRLLGSTRLGEGIKLTGTLMTQRTDIDDGFAVSPDPARLEIDTPSPSTRRSDFSLANIRLEMERAGHLFTSNTGWIDKQSRAGTDMTRRFGNVGALVDPGLPAFDVVHGAGDTKGRSFTEELRVASASDGALSYVGGVFYSRTTYDLDAAWAAPGGAAAWGPLGILLPQDHLVREVDHARATEAAVFADGEYRFPGGWSAGLGGRWYRNKLGYDVNSVFLAEPLVTHRDFAETGFTPKASLKYRFGDQMWYALVSKGYRFGGVNAGSGTTYKSDKLWNYETGLRLAPVESLRLDLSIFRLDWKDAQVNAIVPGPVPLNGIANVGKARIDGLELGATWSATSDITLSANAALLDARTSVDFTSSSGRLVPAGSRLPGTARVQTSLQGSWNFAGPWDTSGRLNLVHSHVGARTLAIDTPGRAPAYDQFDARVSFAKGNWEVGVFVNNIADKRGVAGGQTVRGLGTPDYTDWFLIKPRTTGVTLRYDL